MCILSRHAKSMIILLCSIHSFIQAWYFKVTIHSYSPVGCPGGCRRWLRPRCLRAPPEACSRRHSPVSRPPHGASWLPLPCWTVRPCLQVTHAQTVSHCSVVTNECQYVVLVMRSPGTPAQLEPQHSAPRVKSSHQGELEGGRNWLLDTIKVSDLRGSKQN